MAAASHTLRLVDIFLFYSASVIYVSASHDHHHHHQHTFSNYFAPLALAEWYRRVRLQDLQQTCLSNGTDQGGEERLSHGLLPLSGVQKTAKVSSQPLLTPFPRSLSFSSFYHLIIAFVCVLLIWSNCSLLSSPLSFPLLCTLGWIRIPLTKASCTASPTLSNSSSRSPLL